MRLHLVQLGIDRSEAVGERIDRVRELLVNHDADLSILPELWVQGAFDMDRFEESAQTVDGPAVTMVREVAKTKKRWIHGGSLITSENGKLFNTSFLVNPEGEIAALYKKVHLFGFAGGESSILSAGTELVTATINGTTTALTTCYDLRFPEQYRALTDKGAEIFLIPMGWPERRIEHMRVLAQARAIENQGFVVAVNAVGQSGDVHLNGHSMVIDPWGVIVAEGAANQEENLLVDIDVTLVAKTRAAFPVLKDR